MGTPETYVGSARGESRGRAPLALNEWALTGEWAVEPESARLDAAPGAIAFRYQARDLNLVLTSDAPARFVVTLDGGPPMSDDGLDVDEQGAGVADEPRMYQLVRRRGEIAPRTFEVTFLDPGVRAYVFTFG